MRVVRSSSSSSPNEITVPIWRIGTKVADTRADLLDGSLDSPISEDEYGTQVPLTEVWTASNAGGFKLPGTCLNWTDGTHDEITKVGVNNAIGTTWSTALDQFCDHNVALYCLQQ